MKFRTTFRVSAEPTEMIDVNGGAKQTNGGAFKMPALREQKSRVSLSDGVFDRKDQESQAVSKKSSMRDFFQKTGASIRATGAKLTHRKSKTEPESVRSTPIGVRSASMDANAKARDANQSRTPTPDKRRTRSSTRASSRQSRTHSIIIPVEPDLPPPSQADLDKMPLNADQIRAMFVGAPCFSVEESQGKYKPQVIFRGSNAETSAQFPADFEMFGHPSFAAATLSLPVTRESMDMGPSHSEEPESPRAGHGFMEVPNMRSAQGLDPGTVGFEHFLQLPVADSGGQVEEKDMSERRRLILTDPQTLGLRKLSLDILTQRLAELGELHGFYQEEETDELPTWNEGKLEEMGDDLFGKLLCAETAKPPPPEGTGSDSMKRQIGALQKVLNSEGLWYDFSSTEWRVRVGQILWTAQNPEDESSEQSGLPSERDVLLLQITLAAELLIRINCVKLTARSYHPMITGLEYDALENERTDKVNWDLMLADRFLSNVTISNKAEDKQANRSSFFSAMTFLSAYETLEEAEQSASPLLHPKRESQQLAGLVHFAETLQWPHAQELRRDLDNKANGRPISHIASVYGTPMGSPPMGADSSSTNLTGTWTIPALGRTGSSTSSNRPNSRKTPGNTKSSRLSFFGVGRPEKRPGFSRTSTTQSTQLYPSETKPEFNNVPGWLTRSWLSGLILPGEPTSHLLISALLENTPSAITALGDQANLYGGFVYEGRSFWSKSCVVGRVLAAKTGTSECMGWVSVPGLSEEHEDGWVNLDVRTMQEMKGGRKLRIKDTEGVANDSHLLHNKSIATSLAGDFTRPLDGPLLNSTEVICNGLSFTSSHTGSNATTPMEGEDPFDSAGRATAVLTFGTVVNSKLAIVEVPLTYDAYFVSSYPCHPKATKLRRAPTQTPTAFTSSPLTFSPGPLKSHGTFVFPAPPTPTRTNTHIDGSIKDLVRPRTAPADSHQPTPTTLSVSTTGTSAGPERDPPTPPCHSLHKNYRFDVIPVGTLLTTPTESRHKRLSLPLERESLMSSSAANANGLAADKEDKDVVVLDCRGGEDLELLARAWCAKVGENAVIGKVGRTCLACCVREARALGICIVIRT